MRRRAEARLRDAVGPESRLGGLRVTPFLLRADIRDLHLEGPGYALTVPEARLAAAPRALVGALALESLEVVAPVLRLTPGPSDAPTDPIAIPLASLEIETVTVRDGSVLWSDPANGELEGVALGGAIGSGALTIDAPRGTGRGETTVALGPARARLAVARARRRPGVAGGPTRGVPAHRAGSARPAGRAGPRGRAGRRARSDGCRPGATAGSRAGP